MLSSNKRIKFGLVIVVLMSLNGALKWGIPTGEILALIGFASGFQVAKMINNLKGKPNENS